MENLHLIIRSWFWIMWRTFRYFASHPFLTCLTVVNWILSCLWVLQANHFVSDRSCLPRKTDTDRLHGHCLDLGWNLEQIPKLVAVITRFGHHCFTAANYYLQSPSIECRFLYLESTSQKAPLPLHITPFRRLRLGIVIGYCTQDDFFPPNPSFIYISEVMNCLWLIYHWKLF